MEGFMYLLLWMTYSTCLASPVSNGLSEVTDANGDAASTSQSASETTTFSESPETHTDKTDEQEGNNREYVNIKDRLHAGAVGGTGLGTNAGFGLVPNNDHGGVSNNGFPFNEMVNPYGTGNPNFPVGNGVYNNGQGTGSMPKSGFGNWIGNSIGSNEGYRPIYNWGGFGQSLPGNGYQPGTGYSNWDPPNSMHDHNHGTKSGHNTGFGNSFDGYGYGNSGNGHTSGGRNWYFPGDGHGIGSGYGNSGNGHTSGGRNWYSPGDGHGIGSGYGYVYNPWQANGYNGAWRHKDSEDEEGNNNEVK